VIVKTQPCGADDTWQQPLAKTGSPLPAAAHQVLPGSLASWHCHSVAAGIMVVS